VPRRDTRQEDARALLAITEMMQCKLLSSVTVEYLSQVSEMLQQRLQAEEKQDSEEVQSA
jgi:hypothetical protein